MTSQRSSWKPVIKGHKSEEAWKIIIQIDKKIDSLEKKFKAKPHFHLFTAGHAAALFSYYLYLETGDKKKLKRAHRLSTWPLAPLDQVNTLDYLFSGIAGMAWLVEHIRKSSQKKMGEVKRSKC